MFLLHGNIIDDLRYSSLPNLGHFPGIKGHDLGHYFK